VSTRGPDRRIVEEAAHWSARMMEPQSKAEVDEFEAWLARDPAHPRVYAEIDAVNAAVGAVPLDADIGARPPALSVSRARDRWSSPVWRPALAAALAVLVIVTTAVFWQGASSPAYAAITNAGPAVRGVRLSDGTVVWLDVDAAIGVRLTSARRDFAVRTGRVRLVPASDPRPLHVRAGPFVIASATGRLDITKLGKAVTVAALDSPIALERTDRVEDAPAEIGRGQALTIDQAGTHTAALDPSWPVGRLQFSQTPLSKIVALANRQPGPDIILDDPVVGALRVTGVFDLRDTRRLARKLAATLALDLDDEGPRLSLRR